MLTGMDGLAMEIQDLQDRIEATENELDELKGEAESFAGVVAEVLDDEGEGDLGDTIAHYKVEDLGRFFMVYVLDDEEENMIRERFEDHDLFVYLDGAALWDDGEILVSPDGEFMADADFEFEAGWVGDGVL